MESEQAILDRGAKDFAERLADHFDTQALKEYYGMKGEPQTEAQMIGDAMSKSGQT